MSSSERWPNLKAFLIQCAAGIIVAAITALFTIPNEQLHLNSLAFGIASIPIFIALAATASGLYVLYLIIQIVDFIATKLHLFDVFDDLS